MDLQLSGMRDRMDWIEQVQERDDGRLFELVSYNANNVVCVAFEHNVEL